MLQVSPGHHRQDRLQQPVCSQFARFLSYSFSLFVFLFPRLVGRGNSSFEIEYLELDEQDIFSQITVHIQFIGQPQWRILTQTLVDAELIDNLPNGLLASAPTKHLSLSYSNLSISRQCFGTTFLAQWCARDDIAILRYVARARYDTVHADQYCCQRYGTLGLLPRWIDL